MASIEERVGDIEYYQELGRAVVGMAICDYIKYLKVTTSKCNTKFKTAEAYAWGKSAKRFLNSKESNLLGGISMDINIKDAVEKSYRENKYKVNNVYYKETKKQRGDRNERYRID